MCQTSPTWRRPPSGQASAVLFDLDGTLTRPYLDFDVVRREIGLPIEPRTPILEAMAAMLPADRARAEAVLLGHERQAAEASQLWDDTRAVVSAIRAAGVPVAVMTRNSRQSVQTVIAKHNLRFDACYARDDGPVKPAPAPVLNLCSQLQADPARTWVVGDYLFDIQAGNAAGAITVLMLGDAAVPAWADQARHVIRRLTELLSLLAIPGVRG